MEEEGNTFCHWLKYTFLLYVTPLGQLGKSKVNDGIDSRGIQTLKIKFTAVVAITHIANMFVYVCLCISINKLHGLNYKDNLPVYLWISYLLQLCELFRNVLSSNVWI